MKRIALILTASCLLFANSATSIAQNNSGVTQTTQPAINNPQISVDSVAIINVYDRIHIANKKPIPYASIREADVMWSKDVWRTIDLREKMNQSLYFPTQPINQRMNLFSLIMHGIQENNLHAYQDNQNKMFTTELLMSADEIIEKLGADTIFGEVKPKVHQVKQFLVKEKWFFDKQHSTMRVRIQGLAPIRVYNQVVTDANGNVTTLPEVSRTVLCWIYFPEYRDLFAQYEVYNPNNDSQPISFDDLFIQRRFSSYITKESNVFDNRALADYLAGDDILHESEKIKMKLFDFEHDLWEY